MAPPRLPLSRRSQGQWLPLLRLCLGLCSYPSIVSVGQQYRHHGLAGSSAQGLTGCNKVLVGLSSHLRSGTPSKIMWQNSCPCISGFCSSLPVLLSPPSVAHDSAQMSQGLRQPPFWWGRWQLILQLLGESL